ncbi:AAA family ATPase, partial [Escherichia coli]|nr:AAA family ATPase [Escherichia coli]
LNEKVKQFNLTQSKIQNQFWGALRNYCNTELEVLEKVQAENNITIKNLEECIDSINNEINHTDDEIKQLRNKTSNIDTTISSINSKLKNLGITCFYIDKHPTIKNSFVIVRSDNTLSKNVYRSLSEGEKTLITFLYFIEYCKGQTNTDEFDNRDSLIVIDDPISSLSQNYIYDIASMIHYDIITSADKVIILTHNLYFFHELIKLAPISERKFNNTYQLFRITKNLYSSFSNISRDSLQNEYQSLWQILKDARDGKIHNVVIPNTMRNILEYYFAFVHKTNELQLELNKLAQNESNSNFKAFYRYINRGSHSDSINITDMGEITPDIYIKQFKEIFKLMGDVSHFIKMYEEKNNIEDTTA